MSTELLYRAIYNYALNTHSQLKWAVGVQEIGKNKVSPNRFRMFLSETNGSQGQNAKTKAYGLESFHL